MKDVVFKKKCNPIDLHTELVEAGFLFHGVSCYVEDDIEITVVHLKDAETRDPAPIIDAHVCIPIDKKTALRVVKHMLAGLPPWINNLAVVAEALGVDVSKIPDPPLTQTAQEIITEWITIELLNIKKFNAFLKALGEPPHNIEFPGRRKHGEKGPV